MMKELSQLKKKLDRMNKDIHLLQKLLQDCYLYADHRSETDKSIVGLLNCIDDAKKIATKIKMDLNE